jgi:hypothetical protein
MRRRWSHALALALGLGALGLSALPVQASWMIPPRPYRAKDFTIVKRDGWFHIFYTRTHIDEPSLSELDLGHAKSMNLHAWVHLDSVMPVRPDSWDSDRIWAPHIVERDSVYYMFYTGITDSLFTYAFHQRIGLAVSTDLMTWNRFDEPVFDCSQVPWTLCDTLSTAGGHFRDAYVMPLNGTWVMLYTTKPMSDPNRYVVGLATSDGDFHQWHDGMALDVTSYSSTGRTLAESPHMFEHDSLWYLFFTTDGPNPIWFATSPLPMGLPSDWSLFGPIAPMVGFNTDLWFASERFVDGLNEYFSFVNYDRVDIRKLSWNPDGTFDILQPPAFHVVRLKWSEQAVDYSQLVELRIDATNWFGQTALLELVEVDSDGGEEIVPAGLLGLPDSIPLTDSVTVVQWAAASWPDSDDPDGDSRCEFVMRARDQSAQTEVLEVTQAVSAVDPDGPGSAEPSLRLRALSRTPLGDGPALLVEMPAAGTARVDLFDLQGRRRRTLAERELPAGPTLLPWDRRDAQGARVARGMYFARLSSSYGERWARLVLVR